MQSQTYLKRFALSAIVCTCLTAMACGAALVNVNSRAIALGRPGRQVGLQTDRQTVTFFLEDKPFALPSAVPLLRWARLAPAPAGSLIALGEWIWEAAAG
ncbi:MAG: hypothetical protein LBG83_08885 [Oscillospiraceae bacterium]|jgi:hypothetical protein|nr:hypothetical protein [Oscillospiraceae bacterium]